MTPWHLALYGATGSIGSAIATAALARGWEVTRVARSGVEGSAVFDAVCWAQGANMNDSVAAFDADAHLELYQANCLFVIDSATALVADERLRPGGARMVAISSIWQEQARVGKLSYTVAKAALGGFVRAASVDLAGQGHLINAVLPGALDTSMTRANLSPGQIGSLALATGHARLPDLATVVELTLFLCSEANRSISGQSIAVDLGLSHAQRV